MVFTEFNKENKIWQGHFLPSFYDSSASIGQTTLRVLKMNGTRLAQISDDTGIKMSYDEIFIKTIRAAQNLQKLGYKSGDIFGLFDRGHHHMAPIVFASFCLNCPINPINSRVNKSMLMYLLKITKPKLMFCDIELFHIIKKCLLKVENYAKIFTFGGQIDDSESVENLFIETGMEESFMPVDVDGINDTAAVLFTSGSSSLPKAVCVSHACLLDNTNRWDFFTNDDIFFGHFSIFAISGLRTLINGTLNGAIRIITKEIFSPLLTLHLLEKYKVTTVKLGAVEFKMLLQSNELAKANLSSVKHIFIGGCKFPSEMLSEMNQYLPNGSCYINYGLTETGGSVATTYPYNHKNASVGQLFSNCSIKIIDEHGNRCGFGVNGEICIKTKYKFLGYYDDSKGTNRAIDDEGFFLSGDIGYFDEDGFLYVIGRRNKIIKYNNFTIIPSDIEFFLLKLPDIRMAFVFGIPDDIHGDLPAAMIVRKKGSNINEQHIFDAISKNFSDHQQLRGGVFFVNPTTKWLSNMAEPIKEYYEREE